MNKNFKSFLISIVVFIIFVIIFYFAKVFPYKETVCGIVPPCWEESNFITSQYFFEQKIAVLYTEKFNLHNRGQESFMDAVHREEPKLLLISGIILFTIVLLVVFQIRKKK
jgi:hypothetical protein